MSVLIIFLEKWFSWKSVDEFALVSSLSFNRIISQVAAFPNLTPTSHR